MPNQKKSAGLLSLLTGAVVGAAAVFFSNKENRQKTKKVVTQTAAKAKALHHEIKNHPDRVASRIKSQAKKTADQVKKAATTAKKKLASRR